LQEFRSYRMGERGCLKQNSKKVRLSRALFTMRANL
jgi:hypothetical protein